MALIISLVDLFFYLLVLAIIARILLSWLPMFNIHIDPYNPFVQIIRQISDPILEPFQRLIPPMGGLDISPMIAIIVIQVIGGIVQSVLLSIAYG